MGADYQLKHRKTLWEKIGEMLLSRLTHLYLCGLVDFYPLTICYDEFKLFNGM